MTESWETRRFRWLMNVFPAYRRGGGRVTGIAADWHRMTVKVPLNWSTRNYVGTIYGGAMFSAVDPLMMMMLIKILGRKYVIWDKAAAIRFIRPGRTTLVAEAVVDRTEVAEIRRLLETETSLDRHYTISLTDSAGAVHAEVDKTLYIAKTRK